MTRLVRKAALLSVCSLISAAPALAQGQIPSALDSRIEDFNNQGVPARCARLVGTASAIPSPGTPDVKWGKIIVKVRTSGGALVTNADVVADFNFPGSPCVDSKLCLTPVAGQTLTCSGSTKQVTANTGSSGDATFTFLGASYNTGSTILGHVQPYAPTACVHFTCKSVDLGAKIVAILDQNGSLAGHNGVNGADTGVIISAVIYSFHGYLPRADVNCDGFNNGGDTSFEIARVLEALAGQGSGAGCPAGAPSGYCPL